MFRAMLHRFSDVFVVYIQHKHHIYLYKEEKNRKMVMRMLCSYHYTIAKEKLWTSNEKWKIQVEHNEIGDIITVIIPNVRT